MPGFKPEINCTSKDEPWDHGLCDTGEVRLHYVTQGTGKLVLLHGFPEFWYSWRHQIIALATHFRVIVPDLRGYNESDKPKGVAQYFTSRLQVKYLSDCSHWVQQDCPERVNKMILEFLGNT